MGSSYADIIKNRIKTWDCENLMTGYKDARGQKIPFSSPLMNYCTYGGIPRAMMTEFFGNPGGGKTSTSVDICKNAIQLFKAEWEEQVEVYRQRIANGDKKLAGDLEDLQDRGPKKVLYIDLEHSFDQHWSEVLGLNDSDIDVMQPPDTPAEEILQTIQEITETGEIGLIVLDSVPTLTPKSELDKKIGERTVASLAGLLTVFCRKMVPLLKRYDTTLLVINQTRDNMDNPYVTNTPGGRALKFYAALRIEFRVDKPVDFVGNELPVSAENPSGYIISAKIVKQKSAPWDRKIGSYYLMISSGINVMMDFAQLAVKKYNYIAKSGAWFAMVDPSTGEVMCDPSGKPIKVNGMPKVFEYLENNPEYYKLLQKYIIADIEGQEVEADEAEEEDEDPDYYSGGDEPNVD